MTRREPDWDAVARTIFAGPTDERIPIVEKWRPIPGIRNYEVSNTGKVRSAETGKLMKEVNGMVWLTKPDVGHNQGFKVLTLLDKAWSVPEHAGEKDPT